VSARRERENRLSELDAKRRPQNAGLDDPRTYNLPRVYWPLIGGFIAFLVVLLFLGWILDRSEQRDPGRQQH